MGGLKGRFAAVLGADFALYGGVVVEDLHWFALGGSSTCYS